MIIFDKSWWSGQSRTSSSVFPVTPGASRDSRPSRLTRFVKGSLICFGVESPDKSFTRWLGSVRRRPRSSFISVLNPKTQKEESGTYRLNLRSKRFWHVSFMKRIKENFYNERKDLEFNLKTQLTYSSHPLTNVFIGWKFEAEGRVSWYR